MLYTGPDSRSCMILSRLDTLEGALMSLHVHGPISDVHIAGADKLLLSVCVALQIESTVEVLVVWVSLGVAREPPPPYLFGPFACLGPCIAPPRASVGWTLPRLISGLEALWPPELLRLLVSARFATWQG